MQTQAQTIGAFKKMPAEQKAQLVTDSLKVLLQLTNEQYSKVHEIILQSINKALILIKSKKKRIVKAKKLRDIAVFCQAKLKNVLTPGQWSVYEIKKKNMISYYRQQFCNNKLLFNVSEAE